MRIALCKSHFAGPVSGADEILVTYAIKLRQAGHDVHVTLLYKHSNKDPFYERLKRNGVPVSYVIERSMAFMIMRGVRNLVSTVLLLFFLIPSATDRMRKIWQVLIDLISRVHYRECVNYFAKSNYDLLHVFTPDTGATLMIRAGHKLNIPVLYHEMGTPRHLPALTQYYRRLEKVLPLCSEFCALSPTLASQWYERFPFLKSVSVLPLISEEPEHIPVNPVRRNAGEIIFGCAARLEAGKGILVLLDAVAELRARGIRCLLRIAGNGPDVNHVKARIRELNLRDSCELVGAYSGTFGCSAFMRSLDVFVLPSFAEGTSKSIIEAMAHGLAIIATDVGGSADMLLPNAGIVIPARHATTLASAMEELARDPGLRSVLGRRARKQYQQLFSPAAVLPLLMSSYSEISRKPFENLNGHHPWSAAGMRVALSPRARTQKTDSGKLSGLAQPNRFELDENPAA